MNYIPLYLPFAFSVFDFTVCAAGTDAGETLNHRFGRVLPNRVSRLIKLCLITHLPNIHSYLHTHTHIYTL